MHYSICRENKTVGKSTWSGNWDHREWRWFGNIGKIRWTTYHKVGALYSSMANRSFLRCIGLLILKAPPNSLLLKLTSTRPLLTLIENCDTYRPMPSSSSSQAKTWAWRQRITGVCRASAKRSTLSASDKSAAMASSCDSVEKFRS